MWRCCRCLTEYPQPVAWCWACMSADSVILAGSRPRSQVAAGLHVATARSLTRRTWSMVASSAYPDLRLLAGALVGVYGPPGAGKSTWLLRFLAGLPGAVVLLSAEEGLGPAVGERLSRLGIHREDLAVVAGGTVDELAGVVRERRAVALGVDSVSATPYQAADLRMLLEGLELGTLAFTAQVTKAGSPAGSNHLLHEADVLVEVAGLRWRVVKSRYSGTGLVGDVLDQEEVTQCSVPA